MRAAIKIKNLALRTVIGFNERERNKKQYSLDTQEEFIHY